MLTSHGTAPQADGTRAEPYLVVEILLVGDVEDARAHLEQINA